MKPSLAPCISKVERAKEHRDSLKQYVANTFAIESNRPRCGIKFERETKQHVVFINYMPNLVGFLERCSIIYGDAVINLRSSLDRLAFQLALLNTSGKIRDESSIQFPICDTVQSFDGAKGRWLKEIGMKHITIIESFQGYHTLDENVSLGDYFHPLSMLRDLTVIDKHRLPIRLAIPTSGMEAPHPLTMQILLKAFASQIVNVSGVYQSNPLQFPAAELGAEVMRAELPLGASEFDVDMAGYIAPMIAIEGDRSAVASLDKIASVVVKVIREFEPDF